ncbi:hypothetical protein Agub_g14988 [Astrephomene gubernaculifera]|uniref:Uncharacterized protein n=1 Tax=Astrephomene gubernaculifera TaxID=47775 RepID=A0AAD3HTJ0_9CHLO|nr:hypothetical protein Agub_g14988 [Astrephomene gubernaculifera]
MAFSADGGVDRRSPGKESRQSREDEQEDVWAELFGIVHSLAETVGLSLQAFTPSDDKAVSAITKKRLALRSIQGLKQGQLGIQALSEHLKALQAASHTWQRSMMYASKSHQELMEQVESTTEELRVTSERLRVVEAQRLASVRDAESLRTRSAQQEALIKEMQSNMKQREEEMETLQFTAHEAQVDAKSALKSLELLKREAAKADERAQTATAALEDAKTEAAKAQGLAERHQQVVAKLTADNLVFLMQLKKAEADLAAANQERVQLRLAAEQQRGPWFDQVRAGVEERVRQALQRSQELEARLEKRESEHSHQLEALGTHRAQLEEELAAARRHAEELQRRLDAALESQQRAEDQSAASEAIAAELRQRLDNLAAENRVLQDSVRSMRQECTERWVNEQAALGLVGGLEQRIQDLEQTLGKQTAQISSLQRQLDTQAGVNRQLMSRKEEVEWQLMAAMAKLDGGGAAEGPVPLNLHVSGLLQVGGRDKQVSGPQASAAASGGLKPAALAPSSSVGMASVSAAHDTVEPSGHGVDGSASSNALQNSRVTRVGGSEGGGACLLPEPTLLLAEPDSAPRLGSALTDVAATGAGHRAPSQQQPLKAYAGSGQAMMGQVSQSSNPLMMAEPAAFSRNSLTAGAGAVDTPGARGRRASDEGASTAASSPPSSVVLSAELESPHAYPSQPPPAVGGQAHAAVEGASALAIRIVSTGSRPGLAGMSGHGDGGRGPTGPLSRQGSLHDGSHVWLGGAGSPASSDGSDFLFTAGVTVQHGVHVGGAIHTRPPQQALASEQSQQQQGMDGHSVRPPAANGARQSQLRALPAQQSAPDEDTVSTADVQTRGAGRSASSLAEAAAAGNVFGMPSVTDSLASMYGSTGALAGLFSISKGSGMQHSARASATCSPVHPVFCSAASQHASTTSHSSSLSSQQQPQGQPQQGDHVVLAGTPSAVHSTASLGRPSALVDIDELFNLVVDKANPSSGPDISNAAVSQGRWSNQGGAHSRSWEAPPQLAAESPEEESTGAGRLPVASPEEQYAVHEDCRSTLLHAGGAASRGMEDFTASEQAARYSGALDANTSSLQTSCISARPHPHVSNPHANGMGPQPPKANSVKSVRFSEDDVKVPPPQQQGWSFSDHPDTDTSWRGNHMNSALQPQNYGRSSPQGGPQVGHSVGSPARTQGLLQHPAIVMPAAATAMTATKETYFLDDVEATPSKRYSAAGVVVTAVPRAPS